jgi:hypothetical protein
MNIFLVVTIAIIIVLLYILWRYFSNVGTNLAKSTNLNTTQSTPLKITDSSVQYAYGVWIYVNSWAASQESNGAKKVIFSRSSKSETRNTFGEYTVLMYLDPVSPTLYLDIAKTIPTGATATASPIIITTNFPVQKWCYVVFSLNNQYVDCYIDGKLVKSVHLDTTPITPKSTDSVYIGSPTTTSDIYIKDLQHWANPLTPQQVWSNYLSSSGTNPFSSLTNSMGVGFTFYKDNVESTTFRLF